MSAKDPATSPVTRHMENLSSPRTSPDTTGDAPVRGVSVRSFDHESRLAVGNTGGGFSSGTRPVPLSTRPESGGPTPGAWTTWSATRRPGTAAGGQVQPCHGVWGAREPNCQNGQVKGSPGGLSALKPGGGAWGRRRPRTGQKPGGRRLSSELAFLVGQRGSRTGQGRDVRDTSSWLRQACGALSSLLQTPPDDPALRAPPGTRVASTQDGRVAGD